MSDERDTDIFPLDLPPSLMEEVKERSAQDATSVNQFIVLAVAEKLAGLRTREYFEGRRRRAVPGDIAAILAKAGTVPPRDGDEIPDGWLPEGGDRDADQGRNSSGQDRR